MTNSITNKTSKTTKPGSTHTSRAQASKRPRHAAPAVRTGADGLPEPAVEYMDHAPMHPAFCFTKGLFRSLQNGIRDTALDVSGQYKVFNFEMTLRFTGPAMLDVTDMMVFSALCQQAALPEAFRVGENHRSRQVAETGFYRAGSAWRVPYAVACTSYTALVKGAGLTATGSNTDAIKASLQRLAATTVQVTHINGFGGKQEISESLIAIFEKKTGLKIALNSVASTVLTDTSKGVCWVNMRELRLLKSKPARRLHVMLCAWASSKSLKLIQETNLAAHIYGGEPEGASQKKDRLRTVRAATQEIAKLPGWVCGVDRPGMMKVRKPVFKGTPAICPETASPVTLEAAA
jgi:hypothetical protein